MKCAECGNIMISLELKGIEIDYCPKCGSVWLDSGELEILTETTQKDPRFLDNLRPADDVHEKLTKCPVCRKRMKKVIIGSDKNPILDRCPDGDGVWLNKGELESVLNIAHQGRSDAVTELLKDIFWDKT